MGSDPEMRKLKQIPEELKKPEHREGGGKSA